MATAHADTQIWPEIDGFFPIGERTRVMAMASSTRSEDSSLEDGRWHRSGFQAGAHLDVSLQPLLRPELAEQDWERARFLWMRIGYRYVGSYPADKDAYGENRGILELSARHPLESGWALKGRLKWDLRDIDGRHSNRYRVRAGIERKVQAGTKSVTPYAEVESYYDTRYDTWNRQRYQAGIDIPAGKHWTLEPYLAYQEDRRSVPGSVMALGLTLKYYH